MRLLLVLVLFLSPSICNSNPENSNIISHKKIAVLSIPKSGTYLTCRALKMISDYNFPSNVFWSFDWKDYTKYRSDFNITVHIVPEIDVLKTDAETIKILVVRDLRDITISAVHWLEKNDWYSSFCDHSRFFALPSFTERVSYMISFPTNHEEYSIRSFAHRALEWRKIPGVYICRFEDLVGPKGGGTLEKQIETLQNLALHIGIEITEDKIMKITENLWGNSGTFRNGKIGSWRSVFTTEQKELFKQKMGKELIELGYENDFDW